MKETREQIEARVREKLKDIPEGSYRIGDKGDKLVTYTGKQGYINYRIELEVYLQEWVAKLPTKEWIPNHPMQTPPGVNAYDLLDNAFPLSSPTEPKKEEDPAMIVLKKRGTGYSYGIRKDLLPSRLDKEKIELWEDELIKLTKGTTLHDGTYITGLQYWQLTQQNGPVLPEPNPWLVKQMQNFLNQGDPAEALSMYSQYYASSDPADPSGEVNIMQRNGDGIMSQISNYKGTYENLTKEKMEKAIKDMAKHYNVAPLTVYRGSIGMIGEDVTFNMPKGVDYFYHFPKKLRMVHLSLYSKDGIWKIRIYAKEPKLYHLYKGTVLIGIYRQFQTLINRIPIDERVHPEYRHINIPKRRRSFL